MILYHGMKKTIMFGTGNVADIMGHYLKNNVEIFTVDGAFLKEGTFKRKSVVPFEDLEMSYPPEKYNMFIAIGYNKLNYVRADAYFRAKTRGYSFISYIDDFATIDRTIKSNFYKNVGENTFIFELNNLQYNVRIGNNVILWSGNHIGHETIIRDHTYLASHVVVSGFCDIGEYNFVGVNATFADGIKTGKNNLIGAGTYISKNTEDNQVIASPKSRFLTFEDLSPKAKEMWGLNE